MSHISRVTFPTKVDLCILPASSDSTFNKLYGNPYHITTAAAATREMQKVG